MNFVSLVLGVVLLVSCPLSVSATFYRYYDESGGVNVTNDKNSIPERYRGQMTVISDRELADKAKSREREKRTGASRQQAPKSVVPSAGPVSGGAPAAVDNRETVSPPVKAPVVKNGSSWLDRQLPMLKVMVIIVALVGAVIVVSRLASSLAPRPLAIVIKVALFAGLAVYLVKGMAGRVSEAFTVIKDEANVAQKAVDKRSEKIEKQAE